MAVAELKRGLESATQEERLFLAGYLQHLLRQDDPSFRAELTQVQTEMDAGKRLSHQQVKRLLENLEAEGL